ncbi:MAG: hypothetical protein ACLFOY_04035 [Desulfatibacillaceae bacterium]
MHILYLYFDERNVMPIHTWEVVNQFLRKGHEVALPAPVDHEFPVLTNGRVCL